MTVATTAGPNTSESTAPPARIRPRKSTQGLVFLVLLGLVLFSFAAWILPRKAAWLDEVLTLIVARAPDLSSFWERLAHGSQSDPPLHYLATRATAWFVGMNPVALRIPSVIGVFTACAALYLFAARRVPAAYARLAALFPLATHGLAYACEGRPYGLWLGFSALSLLAWQSAAEGLHRRLALAALAGSLCCNVLTHYYGVLVVAALGLAELARTFERRRIDPWMFAMFVSPIPPLIACRPLIANSSGFVGESWTPPNYVQFLDSYGHLANQSTLVVLVVLLALAAFQAPAWGESDKGDAAPGRIPGGTWSNGPRRHEVAAAMAFTLIPQMGVVLAMLVTRHMIARYGLPALCGLSLLLAFGAQRIGAGRTRTGNVLALTLVVLALQNGRDLRHATFAPPPGEALARAVADRPDGANVLVTAVPHYIELLFHHPELERDTRYVIFGGRSAGLINRKARPWANVPMIEVDDLRALGTFYMCPSLSPQDNELLHALPERGFEVASPIITSAGDLIYRIDMKE